MILYHMSQTLQLGDALTPDYQKNVSLVQPFVQALDQSVDCFYAMVLNGKYLYAVLGKFNLWEWSDYAKWATEGAFEYVRRTQFPDSCSRMKSNYFYDNLPNCKKLYEYDWGCESEEEQRKVRLFEIDVDDVAPQWRDMKIYDEAYNAMSETQNVQLVLDCARRYFTGAQTAEPVWEILSEKPARAVKDITIYLHGEESWQYKESSSPQ